MNLVLPTLLSGMSLLMLQVMVCDFLVLLSLVRRECEAFSHPTKVFPDTYPWDATFGATKHKDQ